MKEDILGLLPNELEDFVVSNGQQRFRAKQIFSWLYKDIESFRDMTNVPKALISILEDNFKIGSLKLVARQVSKLDGTQKFLFELEDGNQIESVFMKYKYGNTVCISTQAGCRMGCKFCASGLLGLSRNLIASEILSQVIDISRLTGEKISNIVLMGTGEPLDNYVNVSKFLRIIHQPDGYNLSMRSITISTCGLVEKFDMLSNDFPQINLAISLHSATDKKRNQIMPINKKFPISSVIDKAREYVKKTGRRISFEYTLAKLLKNLNCHVNLIPLNEVSKTGLVTSGRRRAEECIEILSKKGINATVRRQLGADIDGACGQLRLKQSIE